MDHPSVLQLVFGVLTLATALGVVLSRNPVVSAITLMTTLFLTGGLYFGMGAYFIGAVQILIYAGAIAVLFVFIVMLLELKPFFLRIPGRRLTTVAGAFAAILMLVGLAFTALPASNQSPTRISGEAQVGTESPAESVDASAAPTINASNNAATNAATNSATDSAVNTAANSADETANVTTAPNNPALAANGEVANADAAANASAVRDATAADPAGPRTISLLFLSKYMLPYQVTGLLVLAAVMGVVVLGRPRRQKDQSEA